MNKPRIVSNDLDQAPKNRKSQYQKRLNVMKNEIYKAFDNIFYFYGDDRLIDCFDQYADKPIIQKMQSLQDGESLSIEIKRGRISEDDRGWDSTPSFPKFLAMTKASKVSLLSRHNNTLQS